ncbi:MAG: hypothetical protein AMXMBFR64_36690 [Myxococcales bacterium]
MSKISKFIVLLAGIVGVAAFFLPLASVKDSGFTGQLSAFQIVKGISSTQDVVGEAGKIVDSETDKAAVKDPTRPSARSRASCWPASRRRCSCSSSAASARPSASAAAWESAPCSSG